MTKAVTGVATMMLFEEGAFALADPISSFMPEFRGMRVAVESPDPATGKVSGQTLSEFSAQRILQPLRMVDTAFHVDEEKRDRLVPIID
jgi:CubicO group peptidase (beta-lactamase class C family)